MPQRTVPPAAPAAPAAKPEAPKKPQSKLKIAGGVLFAVAGIAIAIVRMPKREFVQAHADKPRPRPVAEAPSAPAASKTAAPKLGTAAAAAAAAAAKAAVESQAAASTMTTAGLYSAESARDPFVKGTYGGGAPPAATACLPEDFSIHQLNIRMMLEDSRSDFALLTDPCGSNYIFRDGKLLDPKDRAVPGITGKMAISQMKLILRVGEKDEATFRLGGDDEKDKDEKPAAKPTAPQ